MPSGMHQAVINLPIAQIWSFVEDMDNWAPLVPGYIAHEKISDRQSTWEFYSDIGPLKKKISLLVEILEWVEPSKVTFSLKGLNEHFTGNGYFATESIQKNRTRIVGFLDIQAEGVMGKIVNKALKISMPKTAEKLTEAIAEKIK